MKYIKAFFMALGMFSAIPAPRRSWDDRYSALVIPFLPLVGGLIGGIWFALAYLLGLWNPPELLHAALLVFVPFLLSGFLHVDGFMDTADAVLSRRDLAERRRILKDSNVGAFAVIALVCLMLLQLAGAHAVVAGEKSLFALIFIPVMSRCAAGLALLRLRQMYETGYMATFKAGTGPAHTVCIVLFAAMALAGAHLLGGLSALTASLAALAAAGVTTAWVYRQLDGLNGDLCGCIITVGELGGLLCLALI